MPYVDHFRLTDDLIAHLDGVVGGIVDPFLASRYTGFVAVSAVTVLELAFKSILIDFASKKHPVFAFFMDQHVRRLNGRIKVSDIQGEHIRRYGDRYARRFEMRLSALEATRLRRDGISVKASYSNLITWRNEFAHGGQVPVNATYAEVKLAYECGKEIMACVASCMNR